MTITHDRPAEAPSPDKGPDGQNPSDFVVPATLEQGATGAVSDVTESAPRRIAPGVENKPWPKKWVLGIGAAVTALAVGVGGFMFGRSNPNSSGEPVTTGQPAATAPATPGLGTKSPEATPPQSTSPEAQIKLERGAGALHALTGEQTKGLTVDQIVELMRLPAGAENGTPQEILQEEANFNDTALNHGVTADEYAAWLKNPGNEAHYSDHLYELWVSIFTKYRGISEISASSDVGKHLRNEAVRAERILYVNGELPGGGWVPSISHTVSNVLPSSSGKGYTFNQTIKDGLPEKAIKQVNLLFGGDGELEFRDGKTVVTLESGVWTIKDGFLRYNS